MSCSMFDALDEATAPGPSHSVIHPVENADDHHEMMTGLPTFEEFCNNNAETATTLCRMMDDEVILDLLSSLPENLPESLPENLPENQPAAFNDKIDYTSSNLDAITDLTALNEDPNCIPQSITSELENSFRTGNFADQEAHQIQIPHPQEVPIAVATDCNANNVEKPVPEDEASVPTGAVLEPSEMEIDEALLVVLNSFEKNTSKNLLDEETLRRCLDRVKKCPILLCTSCLEVFSYISPFQLHIQTCCDPPRTEDREKMDQAVMDSLARSMWKEVFLREFRKVPSNQKFMQYQDMLYSELDILWRDCSLAEMLKCREVFLRLAVAVASQRWVSTAVANELHRTVKANAAKEKKRFSLLAKEFKEEKEVKEEKQPPQEQTAKEKRLSGPKKDPKKKLQATSSTSPTTSKKTARKKSSIQELSFVVDDYEEYLEDDDNGDPSFGPTRPKRRRNCSRQGQRKKNHRLSETERAIQSIASDGGVTTTTTTTTTGRHHEQLNQNHQPFQQHVTPETPVSDSGVDVTLEMEEIDRFVREGKTDNDLLAAAAKELESIDQPSTSGEWGFLSDSDPLSENEYVVGKILSRRPLYDQLEGNNEEDYEYLVEWEGFGEEENTWEPYSNLKHCTQKMKEFFERLRTQALRKRRGKR